MKLISRFNDFYDYLIGKYGIDTKCVYERIPQRITIRENGIQKEIYDTLDKYSLSYSTYDKYDIKILSILGKIIVLFYYNNQVHFGINTIKKFGLDEKYKVDEDYLLKIMLESESIYKDKTSKRSISDAKIKLESLLGIDGKETLINKELKIPVLMLKIVNNYYYNIESERNKKFIQAFDIVVKDYKYGYNYKKTVTLYPEYSNFSLKTLGVDKIYNPELFFTELSSFILESLNNEEENMEVGGNDGKILSHGFDLKKSFRNNK